MLMPTCGTTLPVMLAVAGEGAGGAVTGAGAAGMADFGVSALLGVGAAGAGVAAFARDLKNLNRDMGRL